MTIRGIFFDAADVFYDRQESTIRRARRLLKEQGYTSSLSADNEARRLALWEQATCGFVTPQAYWDEVLKLHSVSDSALRSAMLAKILAHTNTVRAIAGGADTMAELKRRGFTLGIVTDTIYPLEQKMRWLEQVGVARYVDVVACSTTLGVHKPHPAIYLDAVTNANLTVAESCFVGHDANELAGARRAGMATVAVRHDHQALADYYAASLPDLLDIPILQKKNAKAGDMNNGIEAIFLDVGNTLRIVIEDAPFQAEARRQLMVLAGEQGPEEAFFTQLDARWKAYRKWSFENLTEASERELWTRFLLFDHPAEQIGPLAGKLTRLWRDKDGRRVPRADVKDVVIELSRRGYILGIIANTITETEIPDWIEADGLGSYFKSVVLSSKVRNRKPGPEIYWEAAKRAGVAPEHCAYVGDNPLRDVVGTRRARFGMIIILMDAEKLAKEPPSGENVPDRMIETCSDLLAIFPPRWPAQQSKP